jgi:hypothetical protein
MRPVELARVCGFQRGVEAETLLERGSENRCPRFGAAAVSQKRISIFMARRDDIRALRLLKR